MAEGLGIDNSVSVSTTYLLNLDVPGFAKLVHNGASVTFGDPDKNSQVGELYIRVLGKLHNNVPVVAEESPVHNQIIAAPCMRYFISCIISPVNTLDIAVSSMTSIPVLAFALGILASRLKSNLSISQGAFDSISFVLLLAIGLKGGFALQKSGLAAVALPLAVTIILGCLIPLVAFALLRFVKKLDTVDRGSIAAHYGSTSLVTFTAAIVFLETALIPYEGFVTTLLVAMEIPGILVGVLLARGGLSALKDKELLKEVFLGKTVLLLLGGVLLGFISGPKGFESVKTLFVDAQPGLLTLFLLTLGIKAGENLKLFRQLGTPLVLFAIVMPLIGGVIGSAAGAVLGLSTGGTTALAVLCASASYIAAPAAVSIALPKANPSIPITAALGITFPFNLLIGLPLYFNLASWFTQL